MSTRSKTLIAIPTMARIDRQVTLNNLWGTPLMERVALCPPAMERGQYPKHLAPHIHYVPKSIRGIARTREWIIRKLTPMLGYTRVIMVDDDMDFCYRPKMSSPELVTIHDVKRLTAMFDLLDSWFDEGIVHVGLSARQGNNHIDEAYLDATRMMNCFGYDVAKLSKLHIRFGRVEVMEDFDLTLQLLRIGYPNRVSYQYCWNQRGSGAAGGCSVYRTGKVQAEAAHRLAELHEGYVTCVTKEAKTYWKDLKTRVDVRIQWRKAYEDGKRLRLGGDK